MTILRVFPRGTSLTPQDRLAFVGDPPELPPPPQADEVHVSVTFSWDIAEGKRLAAAWEQYHPVVKLGGPAFGDECHTFIPGRYISPGVTFTSRGCNNDCAWCLVREREGPLVEMPSFQSGNTIQDNNFLQCSPTHCDKVFQMLGHERSIQFSGGLDARLMSQDAADQFRGLKHVRQLFLACDTAGSLKHLGQAVKRLSMPRDKLRCYVLLAHDVETISEAAARLEDVWAAGCMPFAQLYQPADEWIDYPKEWRDLNRNWSRPAIMGTMHKGEET